MKYNKFYLVFTILFFSAFVEINGNIAISCKPIPIESAFNINAEANPAIRLNHLFSIEIPALSTNSFTIYFLNCYTDLQISVKTQIQVNYENICNTYRLKIKNKLIQRT